jgi:hypothetical protein
MVALVSFLMEINALVTTHSADLKILLEVDMVNLVLLKLASGSTTKSSSLLPMPTWILKSNGLDPMNSFSEFK